MPQRRDTSTASKQRRHSPRASGGGRCRPSSSFDNPVSIAAGRCRCGRCQGISTKVARKAPVVAADTSRVGSAAGAHVRQLVRPSKYSSGGLSGTCRGVCTEMNSVLCPYPQPVFRANPRLWRSGFYSGGGQAAAPAAPSPFGWNGGAFSPHLLPAYAGSYLELAEYDTRQEQQLSWRGLRGGLDHSEDLHGSSSARGGDTSSLPESRLTLEGRAPDGRLHPLAALALVEEGSKAAAYAATAASAVSRRATGRGSAAKDSTQLAAADSSQRHRRRQDRARRRRSRIHDSSDDADSHQQ